MFEFPDRFNAAYDLLDSALERGWGERIALRATDGANVSYAQVAQSANRVGNALRELGVEIENRVLMSVVDGPEFVSTFLGAIKLGAVPIPVNTNLLADDYAYFLNDSRAKVAIVSAPQAEAIGNVRSQLRWLRHLVVVGEPGAGQLGFAEITEAASPELTPAYTGPDDVCFWLYSSGTTGVPKGIVHLQHDMRTCVELYAKPILGIQADDIVFSVAKLYFAYGLGNSLYFPLSVGASAVLLAGPPAPATVLDVVRRFRPTIYCAVPTSYANTLGVGAGPWTAADFMSVRTCVSAGEPLAGSILQRWKERSGTDILDGIGSTECCHIFISNRTDDIRPDCSGRIVPGYEARVVDDQGGEVPDGEVGNLMVKGESAFAYFWNQHQRTKQTLIGEWIQTGDKYLRDADGYFYYQGRSDDMLKVGGIWVSPAEVEACINQHPSVLECAVVGLKDSNALIKTCAYVVLQPTVQGEHALEDSLRAHVRERLAHFKCPREFRFVGALPKTATGKIQRYKLRRVSAESGEVPRA